MRDVTRSLPVVPAQTVGTCRWLRWKTMCLDAQPDPLVPSMVDGFVWCVHTMNCLGPDGEVAAHEDCTAQRGCHEARRGGLPEPDTT